MAVRAEALAMLAILYCLAGLGFQRKAIVVVTGAVILEQTHDALAAAAALVVLALTERRLAATAALV